MSAERSLQDPEADLRAYRSEKARNLASVIRSGKLIPAAPDSVAWWQGGSRRFDHAYGRMAEQLFGGLVKLGEETRDERLSMLTSQPNALHGIYVMTRLLSYGPAAYANHITGKAPEKPASLTELGEIMKRGRGILRLFADRDIKSNHMLETDFGLLADKPLYEEVPFVVSPDDNGELVFGESWITRQRAMTHVIQRQLGGTLPYPKTGKIYCPAVGIVLDTLYEAAVDECVKRPELYPADMAQLLPGTMA